MKGPSFPQCSACSPIVIKEYHEKGWEFILKVLNKPEYLEELTGLQKLYEQDINIDWISDDEEEEEP
eukprot:UN21842